MERKKERSYKALEKLLVKLEKEKEAVKEKRQELEINIRNKIEELENLEKSFMDAIRLNSLNIFYCLMDIFRPLYNNYRDDHVILRELTRAMEIIEKRDGVINI